MGRALIALLYGWCGVVFALSQERQCDDPAWMKMGKSLVWPVLLEQVVLGERESICDTRRAVAKE